MKEHNDITDNVTIRM